MSGGKTKEKVILLFPSRFLSLSLSSFFTAFFSLYFLHVSFSTVFSCLNLILRVFSTVSFFNIVFSVWMSDARDWFLSRKDRSQWPKRLDAGGDDAPTRKWATRRARIASGPLSLKFLAAAFSETRFGAVSRSDPKAPRFIVCSDGGNYEGEK